MTADKTHPEPRHTAASREKLPEHLQHLSEGAIIDWLIRTGQWDPAARTTFDVPAAPVSDTLPPKQSYPYPLNGYLDDERNERDTVPKHQHKTHHLACGGC